MTNAPLDSSRQLPDTASGDEPTAHDAKRAISEEVTEGSEQRGDHRLPPLVICAGEAGSGSTWVFNIAAEILRLHGRGANIVRRYLDEHTSEEYFFDQTGTYLIKTHVPPPWVLPLSNLMRTPIVLSVRDPRDAAASLMTRFGVSFETVLDRIAASGHALSPLAQRPNVLVLKYEDEFTTRLETIDAIASHFGVELPESDRNDIFERHTRDAVSQTIETLASQGAFKDLPPSQTWDEETQWHPSHIGDGRSGKWRDTLTEAQAASINYVTREFRGRFGYCNTAPLVNSGATIDFSSSGSGAYYLDGSFADPEPTGIWVTGNSATIRLGLSRPASKRIQVRIKGSLGPSLLIDSSQSRLQIFVNDREVETFSASSENPHQFLLSAWIGDGKRTRKELVIDISTEGVLSPKELDLNQDPRPLAVALASLYVEYS